MKHSFQGAFVTVFIALALSLEAASTIQFAATGYSVAEDAGTVMLTVQRLDDTNSVVGVDFATTNGTATAGVKYTAVSGTLTFRAGVTNQAISVPILNESFVEGTRSFQVILSNPTGEAALGDRSTVTVQIKDNDTGLLIEYGSYWVAEAAGPAVIGVVRGDDGDFPVTVEYATTDGTASAGQDYEATVGTLTFAAGERLKLIAIPIINDALKEPTETFSLTLSNPGGGAVLGSQKATTVTIVDNDPGVQFEFSQYWVQENEETLKVKVLRGNDVDLPRFTVDYATSNLTAVAGEDYTETKGTLAFETGETFGTLSVPILWNQASDLDVQFKLTLSNPSSGRILGAKETATIVVLDMTGMEAHRFDGIAGLPNRGVQLTLGGGVHKRFKDYFDLYPVEVSTNLVDWAPLATLVRTNALTNVLTYADVAAPSSAGMFYRTPTNHLITPILQPTGPFPVGMMSRLVNDPTRRNRYGLSTNGCFMVAIWYPAVAEAGKLPDRLEDRNLFQDTYWLANYVLSTPLIDREPYFVSCGLPGPTCASDQAPYPIVIYSAGGWGARTELEERGPELASHGYVVVAADPVDATATIFPDGTYLKGFPDGTYLNPGSSLCLTDAGFRDRVRDLRFILDVLNQWNETDAAFAGRLDVTSVATMGWSWGGGVAGEVARIDGRCKAAVVIEGYFQNASDLLRLGLDKPALSIYASPITLPGNELQLFNKATHDAVWFQVTSIVHAEFLAEYWYSGSSRLPSLREAMRTMSAYSLWFLNKYLKGSTDSMPAIADYPRIINFKQK